jgi:hypothetical protein
MSDPRERTRIAADMLACKPTEVQARVRAMTPEQRAELTAHIDRTQWVAEYEATEILCFGAAS